MPSPILIAIKQRRSIRDFTDQTVDTAVLHKIIQAGVWAPSGLNNQPWRFVIVAGAAIRTRLATQTIMAILSSLPPYSPYILTGRLMV
ncbi:MAG: nitroreductase family protein [Desulfurivibrionaceae bacterium]|jgi:nitroreductase